MRLTKDVIEFQVFRVLYSPVEAFEKIVKNPKYRGPFLILALDLLATIVVQYVRASKIFLETNGEYVPMNITNLLGGLVGSYLLSTATHFFFNWIIYAAVISLIIRVFRIKTVPWNVFYITIGYVFAVTIIYDLAGLALISVLPPLRLPAAVWKAWDPNASIEETEAAFEILNQNLQENWSHLWAFQTLSYLSYAIDIWTAVLCAIVIRSSHEVTWVKATIISVISVAIAFTLRFFIP